MVGTKNIFEIMEESWVDKDIRDIPVSELERNTSVFDKDCFDENTDFQVFKLSVPVVLQIIGVKRADLPKSSK